MKQRALIFTGLVTAIALIVWMNGERSRLQTQVAALRRELGSRTESTRPIAEMPVSSSAEKAEERVKAPTAPDPTIESVSLPGNDPAWRAARFNEAILRIEAKYGRLFSRLNDWSPERRAALKRLMAENELDLMQSMQSSDAPFTPAGMQTRMDALAKASNENTRRVREMMGETDYAKLDSFEQERSSSESISSITNAMRSNGTDVSGALEESILTSYATALQEAAQQGSATDTRSLTSEQLADLKRQQLHAFHLILLKRMSGVLDEKQLNAFMASLIEQQEPTGR